MHSPTDTTNKQRYSPDIIDLLREVYGQETERCLTELPKTAEHFFFRANTLRATIEQTRQDLQKTGITIHAHERIPEALSTPTQGPFEVPVRDQEIAVDKFTAESVLQGSHVYAPGVVSCQGLRSGDKVTIVDPLSEPVALGVARMDENEILTFRKGLAVEVELARFQVPNLRSLEAFKRGWLYPQSLPSIAVARVLDPAADEIIVDMTCSPGGKLSHICQLTNNTARVVGVDRNPGKIRVTKTTLARLGCENVTLLARDSRQLPDLLRGHEVDKVLLDPPCSALGLRPKLFDHSTLKRITSLASYQKQLLKAASRVVKDYGTVVYSVCTVTREECEDVVDYGVHECGLELVPQEPMIGVEGLGPYQLSQRFHPHIHGTGYFIAKFVKKP